MANEPIKFRMITVEKGEEIELIFDDDSIESLDDLDLTVNYFGSFFKLNLKKKTDKADD